MRWLNDFEERSINSFEELTRAFGARFVTCNRIPSVGKIHVCIAYITNAGKINESTSFTIDNMYYVSFRILEQESAP